MTACDQCGAVLGEAGLRSEVAPGRYCSVLCSRTAEIQSLNPNPFEPALSDDELVAVRQLIEDRFPNFAGAAADPQLDVSSAGDRTGEVSASPAPSPVPSDPIELFNEFVRGYVNPILHAHNAAERVRQAIRDATNDGGEVLSW